MPAWLPRIKNYPVQMSVALGWEPVHQWLLRVSQPPLRHFSLSDCLEVRRYVLGMLFPGCFLLESSHFTGILRPEVPWDTSMDMETFEAS